jgi:hypothetical protein
MASASKAIERPRQSAEALGLLVTPCAESLHTLL